MNQNKIVPSLWFSAEGGKISKIVEYYTNIFGQNFHAGPISNLGETPSGNTELCEVKLFGNSFTFMNTALEHQGLNDAFSLIINCENQNEIDAYWNYFTHEGKASQCGWCVDKYNLRWQILPINFAELMSKPNAISVMMQQTKIVIEEYMK